MSADNFFSHKNSARPFKYFCLICSIVTYTFSFRQTSFHLRMPQQVIFQTISNDMPLSDNPHMLWHHLLNQRTQQRIMRTGQNNRVQKRICSKQFVQIFPDKILRTFTGQLIVLNQRHPHRTSQLCDMEFLLSKQFLYFYRI